MLYFKTWLEAQIPEEAIKIALPKVKMQSEGACGAQAFRAICLYFNKGPEDEKEFMDLLGTTKNGTTPENIVKTAKGLGLKVQSKTGMTIEELISYIDNGMPVICAMQAYGEPKEYNKDSSGHYVVVIGYDKEKIYFEDSSIDGSKRGFLHYKDFLKRWHDKDIHGHDCNQLGIAIWANNPKPHKKITKAKRIE